MRLKSLIHSLPFVAKALGDKMGVKVQVSGAGAWTTGKVINIPILPEDNETAAILARGYLDHEAGHIRFTDCSHTSQIPIVHHLANAIEDVRIDLAMGETFPGCKTNLEQLCEQMVKDGLLSLPEEGDIPAVGAVIAWVHAKLEVEILGHLAMKPRMDDAQDVLEEIFPAHWIPLLGALVDEAKTCSNTREVVAHAEKIINTLKDWATNPPPPPQQQEQQDGNEGDQDNSDDQQAGGGGKSQGDPQDGQNGQDDDADNTDDSTDGSFNSQDDTGADSEDDSDDSNENSGGSGQQDDQEDDQGDSQGQGKSNSLDQNDSDDQDNSDDADEPSDEQGDQSQDESDAGNGAGAGAGNGVDQEQLAKTIEQILNASEEDCKGFDIGEILQEALGDLATGETAQAIRIPEEEEAKTGNVDVHSVRATTAALRTRLSGLVQASRQQKSFPKKSGRKLDTKVLTRLARKNTRVFQEQQFKTAINTAVVVLLDRSGSMNGSRIEVALDSVLAASLAMDAIPGVKVCTAAFPGGNSGWEASVVPLTRFGQSVRATTKHYNLGATGGTPLTEALYWAACQLLAQPEPRKIILVATDGDPNDPASTKFAIRRLEAEGIELLGLGIQHEGVRSLFGTHAVIQNLNELPKSVFGMLQSELVRKRA